MVPTALPFPSSPYILEPQHTTARGSLRERLRLCFPIGEEQDRGMHAQRDREPLGPVDTERDTVVLDRRDRGLRHPGRPSQRALCHLL